jgi:hypothetical protein
MMRLMAAWIIASPVSGSRSYSRARRRERDSQAKLDGSKYPVELAAIGG